VRSLSTSSWRAADDAVTPDLDRIGGRQTHGDGIGVNIETDEQHGAVGGSRWPTEDAGACGHGLGFCAGARRAGFCDSTGLGWRSMYVFMVFVFLLSVVWAWSPTTCGSAPFTRCNPRYSGEQTPFSLSSPAILSRQHRASRHLTPNPKHKIMKQK